MNHEPPIELFVPTRALPGSDQKVKELAYRYASGLPLYHADDATDCTTARALPRSHVPVAPMHTATPKGTQRSARTEHEIERVKAWADVPQG